MKKELKDRNGSKVDWIHANNIIRQSGGFNYEDCRIEVPSFWNVSLFEELLYDYKDVEIVKFLKYGWLVEASNVCMNIDPLVNQQGTRDNPEKVFAYLRDEINNGSVLGPLTVNPFGKEA